MSYLLVGALVLGLLYWSGKPGRAWKLANWRLAGGVAAIGVFAAAAFVAVRGGWMKAALLALIGLGLAMSARWPRPGSSVTPPGGGMSLQEARSLLGVDPQASVADIKAAYTRLMQMAHPDRGGTDGLASQLNRARDRLLKK